MTDIVAREFDFEIAAPLDLVWDALTTSEGLATWYVATAEIDPTPGGDLRVDWGNGEWYMGSFEAVEPLRRLKLVYAEQDGQPTGAEEWLLDHADGVTRVRLIHSMPVEPGATWDGTYGDIVRGWSLFMSTLRFAAERVGRLGRVAEVRLGDIADGAWPRVLEALGLSTTPAQGSMVPLPDVGDAEVLVSVDPYSLLLAVDERATLLVDVEGSKLYTVAAEYGEAGPPKPLVALAEAACTAAGGA